MTTTDLFLDRVKDMSKRRSAKHPSDASTTTTGGVASDHVINADFGRPKQTANAALEMTMVIYGVTVLGMDEPAAIDVASDVIESHVKSSKVNVSIDIAALLAAYRESAKGTLPL